MEKVPEAGAGLTESQQDVSRPIIALVLAAAILIAAGTLWRISVAVPRDGQITYVSAAWCTLAQDFADGIFYRPVVSDLGYGGTRYFPLHFMLQGLLIRAGLDPIRSGYPITFISAAGLVAGIYFLLRQFRLRPVIAASVGVIALSTAVLQHAVTTVRGDLLAAALTVWGVAFAVRMIQAPGKRSGVLPAALFFSLAFMAKQTTLFGLVAAAGGLYFARRRGDCLKLSALAIGLMIFFFLCAVIASNGRIVSNILSCGSAGLSLRSLMILPRRLLGTLAWDPFGAAFIVLAFSALIAGGREVWKSVQALWLLLALAATCVILILPGTTANHLVDVEIAAAVFFAIAVGRSENWSSLRFSIIALLGILCFAESAYKLRSQDVRPQREQLREVYRLIGPHEKPILAENNALLLVNGERPAVMDSFGFKLLRVKHPEVADRLWKELEERRYSAVALTSDPNSDEGREWLQNADFGPGFLETVQKYYQLDLEKDGWFVFKPRDGDNSE